MQEVNGRLSGGEDVYVEFYAKPQFSRANLKVKIGEAEKELKITKEGTYHMQFNWTGNCNLEIGSDLNAYLDDIRVYTYEQYGRIYDKEGNEQDLADDFRILNSQLP